MLSCLSYLSYICQCNTTANKYKAKMNTSQTETITNEQINIVLNELTLELDPNESSFDTFLETEIEGVIWSVSLNGSLILNNSCDFIEINEISFGNEDDSLCLLADQENIIANHFNNNFILN